MGWSYLGFQWILPILDHLLLELIRYQENEIKIWLRCNPNVQFGPNEHFLWNNKIFFKFTLSKWLKPSFHSWRRSSGIPVRLLASICDWRLRWRRPHIWRSPSQAWESPRAEWLVYMLSNTRTISSSLFKFSTRSRSWRLSRITFSCLITSASWSSNVPVLRLFNFDLKRDSQTDYFRGPRVEGWLYDIVYII